MVKKKKKSAQHGNSPVRQQELLDVARKIGIPEDKALKFSQTISLEMKSFLPPPTWMEHYERIHPGHFERMWQYIEREQKSQIDKEQHKMNLEQKHFPEIIGYRKRGQTFALIAVLAIVGIGFLAIILKSPFVGIAAFATAAVGIAGVFISGKTKD